MKKVLIFAPTAPSSGITQYILNFLSYADLTSFQFDLLSFHNPRLKSWAEAHGSKYFDLTVSLYKHPLQYKRFLMQVFSGGYSTVHFQLSAVSTLRPLRYAKKSGIKNIILHSHNSKVDVPSALRKRVFTGVHYLLKGKANRLANVYCTCSPAAAAWMFTKKNQPKVLTLNNAVDLKKFAYNENSRTELRRQHNLLTPYVIGNIARFSAAKNQAFLLRAFALLKQKRQDCTLLLIGEGDLLAQNKQLANELGLGSSVVFLPFQTDIYRYYSAMDLFVLPSLFEGLPITLVEAQANGLPALVSSAVNPAANITGRLEFFNLKGGPQLLAKELDRAVSAARRYNETERLIKAGFSLKEQVELVQNLYK